MTNYINNNPIVNFKVTAKAKAIESLVLHDSHIAERQKELVTKIQEISSNIHNVDLILDAITGIGQNTIKYVCKIRLLGEGSTSYVKEVEGIKPVELVVSVLNEAADYLMENKDKSKPIHSTKYFESVD